MRASYLVCYDICDDKRLRKVFRTMRGFGDHLQYSVFECQLTRVFSIWQIRTAPAQVRRNEGILELQDIWRPAHIEPDVR